jgi:hypothetical protein
MDAGGTRQIVQLVAKMHPELPEAKQCLMATLLVSAIEGLVMSAVENAPALLDDPDYAEELAVLAVSYLKRGGPGAP